MAQTSFDVLTGSGETALGDLVTDAYRTVTAALFPTDPPVIGIDAAGGLRANIAKGKTGAIAFADAFNVIPLGIGPDTLPGLPAGDVLPEPQRHPRRAWSWRRRARSSAATS